MSLVTKIRNSNIFLPKLTCCSHSVKTISNIKNKLTPRQLYMFRKTTFNHFLDIRLMFSGSLCDYVFLREFEDDRCDVINFNLLRRCLSDKKILALLRGWGWGIGQDMLLSLNRIKALRLRRLYLAGRANMNGSKLDKDYQNLQFEGYKPTVKISLLYFIELAVMGIERRQYIELDHVGPHR